MKREIGEEHVSMLLRSLPPREPPAGLNTSLRVIASRERQRMLQGRGLYRICASWLDRTRLWSQQLLRPLALPAAGGVFSAVVLFSMWLVPTYPLRAKIAYDIPTNLSTPVSASSVGNDITQECAAEVRKSIGVGLTESVLVDVDVDNNGDMVDYRIVIGESVLSNPATRRRVENLLLFTKFAPATTFGTRRPGTTRVLLLPSAGIDVKG